MEGRKMSLEKDSIVKILTELLIIIVKGLCVIAADLWESFVLPSRKKVSGKIVLITGGSRGLGREIAIRFGKLGATVVLWSTNQTAVDSVAKEIKMNGGKAYAYECDVADEARVRKIGQLVMKEVGEVDILIQNAGVFYQKPLTYQNSNQIRRTMEVNLLSHYWTVKTFLPNMIKRGQGHIVAISSIAGMVGGENTAAYCASKFGVIGLMESLAAELSAQDGIHLTTICPGCFTSGLLNEPSSRFPIMFPICTLEEVADSAIDGILRNKTRVVIPKRIGFLVGLSQSLLPRKVAHMWQNFFQYLPECQEC